MADNCTNRMSFYRPEWGGDGTTGSLKRKFRWYFRIENITGDVTDALPCIRASRPKIQFREMQAEHLNETIFFPSKPDWQPIQLVLYDRCMSTLNPIFSWLKQQYNPDLVACSAWYPCLDTLSFKPCAFLELYDGCGNQLETWVFEHVYPQNIDWGELDMASDDVVTVDFSLRYDRAYQTLAANGIDSSPEHILYTTTICGCPCPGQSPPPTFTPCSCPQPQAPQTPPQLSVPPFPPSGSPSPPSPGPQLGFTEVPDFVMF